MDHLWFCVLFFSCFRVCSLLPCGHLLGKGWPLSSCCWCLLYFCYFPMWYPGSGMALDCIDSWSLSSFLLWNDFVQITNVLQFHLPHTCPSKCWQDFLINATNYYIRVKKINRKPSTILWIWALHFTILSKVVTYFKEANLLGHSIISTLIKLAFLCLKIGY